MMFFTAHGVSEHHFGVVSLYRQALVREIDERRILQNRHSIPRANPGTDGKERDYMFKELHCKECGAAPKGMKQCHELFDDLLGIKYLGDGEAYRLAVACYTFQHPHSHSAKAWHYAHAYLTAFVHDNLPSKQARQEANATLHTLNPEKLELESPLLHQEIPWPHSILDFSNEVQRTPIEAAETWAHSLLQAQEEWFYKLSK